jgi:hypothetical protein
MGSCCPYKEFLKDLDYIQNEMNVWGHDYDMMQLVWALKNKIKEFYPINQVPTQLYGEIVIFEERIKVAQKTLWGVCELLKNEVIKKKKEEYPDA